MNRRPLVSVSPDPAALLALLPDALRGTGPVLAPTADVGGAGAGVAGAAAGDLPEDAALVVATSGSTGTPRGVVLTAPALRASADATRAHLGGPGQWLLALPTTHVAGLQVLVRSVLDGTRPVTLPGGPFRPQTFAQAMSQMGTERRYASLVPTQLRRLLAASPETGALDALRTLDAVLVGGAALSPDLADRARAAGVRVVRTYGMTETCGGCVYDGRPLEGVVVATGPDGRLRIAGPMLAAGYLGDPAATARSFVADGGRRWLVTQDL
ncbi:MAG: AMP-binding protein, partial [Cellulomonadaceae bacterium]